MSKHPQASRKGAQLYGGRRPRPLEPWLLPPILAPGTPAAMPGGCRFTRNPVVRDLTPPGVVAMKISNHSAVPVYTISGSSTARPLPEWLARKRKRSLKNDSEYANRIELLQDFEFEEASQCVRVSDDGQWIMSTGNYTVSSSLCMRLRFTSASPKWRVEYRLM